MNDLQEVVSQLISNKKIAGLLLVTSLLSGLVIANSYIDIDEGFYFEGSQIQDSNQNVILDYDVVDEEWNFQENISMNSNIISDVPNTDESSSPIPREQVSQEFLGRHGADYLNGTLDMDGNRVVNLGNSDGRLDAAVNLQELENVEGNLSDDIDSVETDVNSLGLSDVLATDSDAGDNDIEMSDNNIVNIGDLTGEGIVDSNEISSDSVGESELDRDNIQCMGQYC